MPGINEQTTASRINSRFQGIEKRIRTFIPKCIQQVSLHVCGISPYISLSAKPNQTLFPFETKFFFFRVFFVLFFVFEFIFDYVHDVGL